MVTMLPQAWLCLPLLSQHASDNIEGVYKFNSTIGFSRSRAFSPSSMTNLRRLDFHR